MPPKLVINVTGAATGFGALMARVLAKRGHIVFAGLRDEEPHLLRDIETFGKENKADLRPLHQDMLSDQSVHASVQKILSQTQRLDVIIHNCGHMVHGPLEAFTTQQLAEQYDINVLSTQRLNRAALPHMRKQRAGLLVWISSSSVHGANPPFLGPYFAAKAGMDALAMSYELELSQWGIESCIVVPGAFSRGTSHFATAGHPADEGTATDYRREGAPYEGVEQGLGAAFGAFEPKEADIQDVAHEIASVVDSPHGSRPRRVHIDPAEDGAQIVSEVRERLRRDRLRLAGYNYLLDI
ncbi:short-chain dehydrogenase/reductase SDR [Thozetella sp. PMI_491]|nr:short-chain dehydrogenase/reductase SDR [Thozetella sp. PMI_491]